MGYLPETTRVVTVVHFPSLEKSALFAPMKRKTLGNNADAFAALERACDLGTAFGGAKFLVVGGTQLEKAEQDNVMIFDVPIAESRLADCALRAATENHLNLTLTTVGTRRMAVLGSSGRAAGFVAGGPLLIGPRAWVERWLTAPPPRRSGPPSDALARLIDKVDSETHVTVVATQLDSSATSMAGAGFTDMTVRIEADSEVRV